MRKFFLTVMLAVLFGENADASPTADINLVIAADQSRSMHGDSDWSWVQADVLVRYFSQYTETCARVRVTYFVWGGSIHPVASDVLTGSVPQNLAQAIDENQNINLEATDHRLALETANSYFVPGERNIVIFTTDQMSTEHKGQNLTALIPPAVELYTLSLGGENVKRYVANHITPLHGHHYHAETGVEFGEYLMEILNRISVTLCTS